MNKILVIGQAPPAVTQTVPYDTTLLYEMLSWVGINKEQAQDMFEFDAVYNKFTGYGTNGHNKPTKQQMDDYFPVLVQKINKADNIIVLGNVAKEYLTSTPAWNSRVNHIIYLIHPSKRNYDKILKSKDSIIKSLQSITALNQQP